MLLWRIGCADGAGDARAAGPARRRASAAAAGGPRRRQPVGQPGAAATAAKTASDPLTGRPVVGGAGRHRRPAACPGPAGSRTSGWSGRAAPRRRRRRCPRSAPSPRAWWTAPDAVGAQHHLVEHLAGLDRPRRSSRRRRQRATARPPAGADDLDGHVARAPAPGRPSAAGRRRPARRPRPTPRPAGRRRPAARRRRPARGRARAPPRATAGHHGATGPGRPVGRHADPQDAGPVGVARRAATGGRLGPRRTTSSRRPEHPDRRAGARRPGAGRRSATGECSLPPKAPPLAQRRGRLAAGPAPRGVGLDVGRLDPGGLQGEGPVARRAASTGWSRGRPVLRPCTLPARARASRQRLGHDVAARAVGHRHQRVGRAVSSAKPPAAEDHVRARPAGHAGPSSGARPAASRRVTARPVRAPASVRRRRGPAQAASTMVCQPVHRHRWASRARLDCRSA